MFSPPSPSSRHEKPLSFLEHTSSTSTSMESSKNPSLLLTTLPVLSDPENSTPSSPGTPIPSHCGSSRPHLLTYDELPSWLKDNPLIHASYRPPSNSLSLSFISIFHLHNETLNIHTHSLPFLLSLFFAGFIFYIFAHMYPLSTPLDRVVFCLFFIASSVCFGLSTAFHMLMNHSPRKCCLWLKLDFVGIVVMILGEFGTGIFVAFYCEWRLRVVYWVMILGLSIASVVVLLHPHFQGLKWRTFRLCTFVGTACSGIAPIVNAIVVFGWRNTVRGTGMPWYLGEAALLVLGAVFYGLRIPERYKPGGFDIIGHSHQIFHVLVVAATGVHLVGLLTAYDYEYHHPRCAVR